MSEYPDELRICPHCGQENASHTLRCIRCGQELEELFELEGFDPPPASEDKTAEQELTPMAEILASLEENPLLSDGNQSEPDNNENEVESLEGQNESDSTAPDWLERIRQRAKEEDAAGELAKGAIAMDDRRSQEGRQQVDDAFEEIMRRIREQNEREKARKVRRVDSEMVDENGDPEWLRRIRELHPEREDDTQANMTVSAVKIPSDDEWTEEELQELLLRETGLSETPQDQPEEITTELKTPSVPAENNQVVLSTTVDEALDGEPDQVDNEPEVIHNIPEDEDEIIDTPEEENLPPGDLENQRFVDEPLQIEGGLSQDVDAEPDEPLKEEEDEPASEDTGSENESKDLPPTEEALSGEEILPDLLLLKNQRGRAQVFNEIIGQEGRRTINVLHKTSRQSAMGRLVLGLLLILGVLLAILLGPSGTADLPVSVPAAAFARNLESISSADSVLIVLDYQAVSRNDIEPMAEKALATLEEKGSNIRLVTSNPENIWLTGNLLEPNQVPDEFIPGGMLGYLALTVGESPDWGELPIAQVFNDDPNLFEGVQQVILISDSAEFVRMWLEQIGPWKPDIQTSAITTSISVPILLPYYDSNQLQGIVGGLADARALEVEPQKLVNQRAFQVGMLLMIVILILGMIMKADEDAQRRSEERRR